MFDLDTWQEILNTISKNLIRTFLTGLSVAWGIFMLMILLGMGKGLENGFKMSFEEDAANGIWINGGETSLPHAGLQAGRRIQFTNEDHVSLANSIQQIEHISSEVRIGSWAGSPVHYKRKEGIYAQRGVHPEHLLIEFKEMVEGRFINHADVNGLRKVAVIGETAKDELFGEASAIGEYIAINNIQFVVAGVFKEDLGQNQRGKIYLPISTAQKAYGRGKEVDEILFTLKNTTVDQSKSLVQKIRNKLAFRHQFNPADPRAIYLENNFENLKMFSDIFGGINTFIWIIGLGTIVAGIVGVGNIMTVVIKERTKEIGIRKALGATPYNIVNQILKESILITGLFGIGGLIGGIFLLETIAGFITENNGTFYNPTVNFGVAIASTVLIILSGTIAGMVPAIKAASIPPVVALRDE